jgi:hypothetical protein
VFGGAADLAGIRASFVIVGVVVLGFTALAGFAQRAQGEVVTRAGLGRALRDARFGGGLWLNTLAALLLGLLVVRTARARRQGLRRWALQPVFFVAGLFEVVMNPLLGRVTDRVGRLLPIPSLWPHRSSSAWHSVPLRHVAIAVLVCAAAITSEHVHTRYGAGVRPSRIVGLARGLAFRVVNTAWAFGEVAGPTVGGALANSYGDAAPYLACAALCGLTLVAAQGVAGRKARLHAA